PLCFSNGFREWAEIKKYIVEALADSWEFNSQILFTKLDECNSSNGEARVRVLVKRWDQANWYGKTYSAGGTQSLKTGEMRECNDLQGEDRDGCFWSM